MASIDDRNDEMGFNSLPEAEQPGMVPTDLLQVPLQPTPPVFAGPPPQGFPQLAPPPQGFAQMGSPPSPRNDSRGLRGWLIVGAIVIVLLLLLGGGYIWYRKTVLETSSARQAHSLMEQFRRGEAVRSLALKPTLVRTIDIGQQVQGKSIGTLDGDLMRYISEPFAVGDTILVGYAHASNPFEGHGIIAYDANTGAMRWHDGHLFCERVALGAEVPCRKDAEGSPLRRVLAETGADQGSLENDQAILYAGDDAVYRVNLTNGNQRIAKGTLESPESVWSVSIPEWSRPCPPTDRWSTTHRSFGYFWFNSPVGSVLLQEADGSVIANYQGAFSNVFPSGSTVREDCHSWGHPGAKEYSVVTRGGEEIGSLTNHIRYDIQRPLSVSAEIAVTDSGLYSLSERRIITPLAETTDSSLEWWEGKSASILGSVIIVSDHQRNRRYGFDAETGEKVWESKTTISSLTEIYDNERILYLNRFGELMALNTKTGKTDWSLELPNVNRKGSALKLHRFGKAIGYAVEDKVYIFDTEESLVSLPTLR